MHASEVRADESVAKFLPFWLRLGFVLAVPLRGAELRWRSRL